MRPPPREEGRIINISIWSRSEFYLPAFAVKMSFLTSCLQNHHYTRVNISSANGTKTSVWLSSITFHSCYSACIYVYCHHHRHRQVQMIGKYISQNNITCIAAQALKYKMSTHLWLWAYCWKVMCIRPDVDICHSNTFRKLLHSVSKQLRSFHVFE